MRMNRLILLVFLSLVILPSFAQKKPIVQKGHKIEVKLRSTPKDTLFYMISYYGNRKVKVDSAYTTANQRNKFVFNGDSTLPAGIYLVVNQRRMQLFEFIIDKSQHFSVELDTLNPIKSIVVKNSPETALFYKYLKELNSLQDSVRDVEKVLDYANQTQNKELFTSKYTEYVAKIQKVDKYTYDFVEKHPNEIIGKALRMNREIEIPELPTLADGTKDSTWGWLYYKNHYWDNTDLTDARLIRTPVFGSKITSFFDNLISQHPDSIAKEIDLFLVKAHPSKDMTRYMLTWFTDRYQQSTVVGHDAVFVHLVERYFMSGEAPWMTENMLRIYTKRAAQLKSLLIGAKIPELVMADTAGVELLSSYHTGSKYTILWFWDPDCAHCVVETPKLLEFYHQYKSSIGVEVYAVSLDRDLERWKKYVRDNQLDWINVGGEKANIDYTMVFDIVATPVIYVFDDQKRIIAKNIPIENLKELFERYDRIFNQKK